MKSKILIILFLFIFLFGCKTSSIASQINKYMLDNNITLTAKDIQYNMENNLDQKFCIEGICELSDYYNYGYKELEKLFFCIKISQVNGDDWYLYCDRLSLDGLYQQLKETKCYADFICVIKPNYYEKGQGTMAFGLEAQWTKAE